MKKILTIIIPTYNMEKYLRRCLDSLIVDAEKMAQLEVLVVNDGSKDASSAIAHEYEAKYPQTFRVIDKENGNYGSCVNRGLKEANGKYVKILDADDLYITENLAFLIYYLGGINVDVVFTAYEQVDEELCLVKEMRIPQQYVNQTYRADDVDFEKMELLDILKMHCTCAKRSLLVEHGYSQIEGISYTDTQFPFSSLMYADSITFVDKIIYRYVIGRGGQTVSIESMLRSNMHFYYNAYKMLNELSDMQEKMTEIRTKNLLHCIADEVACFMRTLLKYGFADQDKLDKLIALLEISHNNNLPNYVEAFLLKEKCFYCWYKLGINANIISAYYRLIKRIKDRIKSMIQSNVLLACYII